MRPWWGHCSSKSLFSPTRVDWKTKKSWQKQESYSTMSCLILQEWDNTIRTWRDPSSGRQNKKRDKRTRISWTNSHRERQDRCDQMQVSHSVSLHVSLLLVEYSTTRRINVRHDWTHSMRLEKGFLSTVMLQKYRDEDNTQFRVHFTRHLSSSPCLLFFWNKFPSHFINCHVVCPFIAIVSFR
jgi:hypothetical protein